MKRRSFLRSGLVTVGAALTSARVTAQNRARLAQKNEGFSPGNPFTAEGNWYKAALHVHTKTSDGDVDVVTRLKQYRDAGYHVVAVTDHWKTNDLSNLSDANFLAINGVEIHPKTQTGQPNHHLVCLDVPHPFKLDGKMPAQMLVDKVHEAGGKVIYAHPYWTEHSLDEMREIKGFVGIEVYNAHCELECAKGYNDVHIDQAFSKLGLFGLAAVDDVHKTAWVDRGWTMIRAKDLAKDSIMAAITAGYTYASTGAVISDFRVEDGVARLTCPDAVCQIRFFFSGEGGGIFRAGEGGKLLTEAQWKIRKGIKWVRAEVVDAKGKHAWTNPVAIA